MGNSASMDEADISAGDSYIVHYDLDNSVLANNTDPYTDTNRDGIEFRQDNNTGGDDFTFDNDDGKTFDTITTKSSDQSHKVTIDRGDVPNYSTKRYQDKDRIGSKSRGLKKESRDDPIEELRDQSIIHNMTSLADSSAIDSLVSREQMLLRDTNSKLHRNNLVQTAISEDGLKPIATILANTPTPKYSGSNKSTNKDRFWTNMPTSKHKNYTTNDVPEVDSYHSEDDYNEGVDLRFVEQFEATFDAFMAKHPELVSQNPELVERIRILKLEKLLDVSCKAEGALRKHIEATEKKKSSMASFYQEKLVDAARQKASREIQLEHEWKNMANGFRIREGELAWKLLKKCRARAIKYQQICKNNNEPINPRKLIEMLPEFAETQIIRDAVLGMNYSSSNRNIEEEIRRCQIDNAFLSAEVDVMEKKVAYQEDVAKKFAWVDTALVRLDDTQLDKLRTEYRKKLGI